MWSAGTIEDTVMATMKRLFKMDRVTHVASVELWVLLTTLLLVVRFLLDCFGPWNDDRAMATTLQVIEMLNYSMVHYTLGLMQLSANRVNDYFQVWAVLLVTLQYSVKTGRLYRRSKQMPLLDLMSSLWAANLLRMQTFSLLRIPLWLIWALNAVRIISYFASSDRAATINQDNTRLVSDYMRYEHTLGPSPSGDAAGEFRMQWCQYLVRGEDLVLHDTQLETSAPTQYRVRLDPNNNKLVTIQKIWDVDAGSSRLLGDTTDTDHQLKDVCLSFALYKLLRRRFYNLPIHEASQEKTRRLVFDYILQENSNNYERAFRIAKVELSFLQDFFYSKHAAMFADGFPVFSTLMSLSLVAATGYLAYPVHYIPQRMDQADKNIITHGVIVTRIIISLIIAKELSEVYLYVFSQWTKVLMICMHVKHRCWQHPMVEAAMRMMFWFIRGKWDHMIFQYNFLISDSNSRKKSPQRIKLESEVKTAIFESFKGLQQHPERLESYFLNAFRSKEHLMQQLTWATELEADTHRILVWHIATCFCEIHFSDGVLKQKVVLLKNGPLAKKSTTPEDVWPQYLTAVSLSNYCAYLLTKALVPDNGILVRKVLNAVRMETFRATYCCFSQSMHDVYEKLIKIATKPSEEREEVVSEDGEAPENSVIYEEGVTAAYDEEDPNGMGNGDIYSSITNDQVPNSKSEEVVSEEGEAPENSVIYEEGFTVASDEEDPNGMEGGNIYGSKTNDQVSKSGDTMKADDDIHNSIIQMGAKLGKQLIEIYEEDRIDLWKDLAAFWTGFLLDLAASTRAAKHKTRLVGKEELITQLWALLSHAGFLGNTRHGQTLLDPEDLDDIDPLR
ncbi:hypothetical protein CFC21_014146 [Triticum aestivum]|uniref:DUF4220 domain-containing protein n=2 Tax=Triticum aestivum TaxID=4565 RepID=A0A3B6A259_WHEAT|nr:hypothetical protein CFC21_014146 [Triticum aestivum]